MLREDTENKILQSEERYMLLELPTSFGKSKIALDLMSKRLPLSLKKDYKILIVIPRLVLIDNWKDEFKKWGYSKYIDFVKFVTYVSFPKITGKWDMVIFDEAHHLSERCREHFWNLIYENMVMLSATVGRNLKIAFKELIPELWMYRVSARKAIEEEVLPDPQVYLIPLHLDHLWADCEIIKNKSQHSSITISYAERWKYSNVKNKKIIIKCTEEQYYQDMTSMINWYKRKSFNSIFKNMFLKASGDRLKWLSNRKSSTIIHILKRIGNNRSLVFCNSIDQTNELGKYCINSKNKESEKYLNDFNAGKINHITACNMLDEGVNLVNCRVGIYAVLNSSERMIKQKLGRLLRHPDPIIIIPYYKGTRDEELVRKMLEDYNPQLVNKINLEDLEL